MKQSNHKTIHPHLLSAWFGKPKKRTLRRILTLFLSITFIISSIGYWLFILPQKTQAAWYDDNWTYRTPTTITHNAAVTNTKVKFDIDTADLILKGKMQSDCGDSRFTDFNGKLLRYYLDSSVQGCNNTSTDYYVLIPTIINGTTIIYHYYGNPTAANGTEAAQLSESTTTPSGEISPGSEEKGPSPFLNWKFDDGTGTTAQDSSTNGLDGTLNNSPAWQTEDMCISGKCIYFDGTNNNNVSKSDDAKLDFVAADNFTIQAWARRNGASSANNFIITKAQTGYTGYKLYQDASGDYCFDVSDGTNTDTACTSAVEFDDNLWHHVLGVKTGTTKIELYVDGKLRATDSSIAATGTLANTGTFYAGVDLDGTSNEWLGFIDEVKVYNYARSAAQIQLDFNSKAGALAKGAGAILGAQARDALNNGLVGYWRMDETSGNAADSSGLGNTGTWNGTGSHYPAGKFRNGGGFNGTDDYIQGTPTGLPTGNVSVTLSAWIKMDVTQPSGVPAVFAYGAESNNQMWGMGINNSGFYFLGYTNDLSQAWSYSTGVWYHVVLVTSGKTVRWYVDGTQIGSDGTLTNTPNVGSTFFIMSKQRPNNAVYFQGSMDEVRLYNRTLSSGEVRQLYYFAPNLIGRWKMDEASANTCTGGVNDSCDSSGNAYDGAWNGNATSAIGKFGGGVTFDGTGDYVDAGDIGL